MPVDLLDDPWRYAHRAATLPVRPLGNLIRRGSNAMTDLQPVAAELGDKAVDAFAGPISDAASMGLNAASDALLAAGTPAAAGALATAGGAGGAGAGSVAGPLGTAVGGGIGSILGGLFGTGGTAAAAGLGKSLAAATPALAKLAAPAVKAAGRVAYHGLNDVVDGTANVLGSYDDNPATSRGLRALKDAQNPFSLKELTKRGPSDWAREAGGVSELIDTSIGDSPAPAVSPAPMPMDDRGPAGDALKKSAPALDSTEPQGLTSIVTGGPWKQTFPPGTLPQPGKPGRPQMQMGPLQVHENKPLTNLLSGAENPVEKAEPMSEAAEGPPHPEPTGPFKYDDPNRPMTPGQKQGWGDATGGLSQLLNNAKYRGQQSPNDTFGFRGRR